MICVSLANNSLAAYQARLATVDFAEIRLDLGLLNNSEIRTLFAEPKTLIATYRPGTVDETIRIAGLETAIEAGASYIDIECDSDSDVRQRLIAHAHRHHCRVIVSYHNEQETPSTTELMSVIERCRASGADLVKLACFVREPADNARLLGLLDTQHDLIAIGMGDLGKITRVAGPLLGAPFTYAADEAGRPTAPGQLDYTTMNRLLADLHHD